MSKLTKELQDLITQLVSLHGEEGPCPTKEDWAAILRCPEDHPLNILNLLRFKHEVESPSGPISGMAAYGRYSTGVGSAFVRAGGKTLYFGKVNHIFGTLAGTAWHAAILTQYPSPRALAGFWLDTEFIAAHAHRTSGIEASRVLVMSAPLDV